MRPAVVIVHLPGLAPEPHQDSQGGQTTAWHEPEIADGRLRRYQDARPHCATREVRYEAFQTVVFFFHLPKPGQFTRAQMGTLLLPHRDGGVTHPELPAEIADLVTDFGLSDGIDDLLLRAFRLLHRSPLFARDR